MATIEASSSSQVRHAFSHRINRSSELTVWYILCSIVVENASLSSRISLIYSSVPSLSEIASKRSGLETESLDLPVEGSAHIQTGWLRYGSLTLRHLCAPAGYLLFTGAPQGAAKVPHKTPAQTTNQMILMLD